MKKILVLSVLLFTAASLRAQFVYDYLKGADAYFEKGDYASAAEYYEKSLGRDAAGGKREFNPYTPQNTSKKSAKSGTTREMAIYRLGECYRLLNYPAKAEPYYKEAMTISKTDFPLAQYHYATQLRALAKYAEAEQNMTAFLSGYPTNDAYKKNAEREVQNLRFIQQQLGKKDLKYYKVAKAPAGLNATGASYAPVWAGANSLLFTSTRPLDTLAKTKQYSNRLYQAQYAGGVVNEISTAALPEEKGWQQGVASLSPDGNHLFLTRWTSTADKKTSAIWHSSKTADGWSAPEKLGENINAAGANAQQPFVTPDGKHLLFSSNRAGGSGGYDIWYAPLKDGVPGAAMNMGSVINTADDEQAPSYHPASQSLVFSSNGRVGMGGYDFFQSKGSIGGSWGEVSNLGYPVNSIKDDLYFVSRGPAKNILEDVLLSSDRDAACCLELFAVKKTMVSKQVSGLVVSCETKAPLAGATVNFINPADNSTVLTRTTGADGTYSIVLDEFQPLKAVANAPGYVEATLSFNSPGDAEAITLQNPSLCLDKVFPPPVGTIETIDNIYFEFDKADLKEESYPALDKLAENLVKHPNAVLEIGGHTDSKGNDDYNLKLSDARAKSCVDYLLSKGVKPEQLQSKGYGETMPLAPNQNDDGSDNPEGRARNRRTEFKVLKGN